MSHSGLGNILKAEQDNLDLGHEDSQVGSLSAVYFASRIRVVIKNSISDNKPSKYSGNGPNYQHESIINRG